MFSIYMLHSTSFTCLHVHAVCDLGAIYTPIATECVDLPALTLLIPTSRMIYETQVFHCYFLSQVSLDEHCHHLYWAKQTFGLTQRTIFLS